MEPGLDEMWSDGICCTGLLVKADPQQVSEEYGRVAELVADGKVIANPKATPVAYVMCSSASDWAIVEFHRRIVDESAKSGEDYLLPLFAQALGALRSAPPEIDSFAYETPVSAAARISRALTAPAIAVWGSDEQPELAGGAFFGENGKLQFACSGHSVEDVDRALVDRKTPLDELDEEDEMMDESESTFVYSPGQAPVVKAIPVAEYLDEEFRNRGAAFDNADLLQDLYRAVLSMKIGDLLEDVDSFHISTPKR